MRITHTLIFLLFVNSFWGISYQSNGTGGGNWFNANSWNPVGIPTSSDDVTILAGDIITHDNSETQYARCANFIVNVGGTLELDNNGYELRISTGKTFENNGLIQNGWIEPGNTNDIDGTGTFSNVGIVKYGSYFYLDGNFTFDKPVLLSAGADLYIRVGKTITFNNKVQSNSSDCYVLNSGKIILNDLEFTNSLESVNGDIEVNVSGELPIPDDSYKNVALNAANTFGSGGYGGGTNVIINGNLSISANNTFTRDIDIKGNLVLSNNSELNTTSITLNFNGSSPQAISGTGSNIMNISQLILNNSSGLTLGSNVILNISDVMQSTNGTVTQNGSTVNLQSNTDDKAGMVDVSSASADYSYSSGVFTSNRFLSGLSNGWRMISSPIKSSTLNDVDDEFVFCGITGGLAGNNHTLSGCGGFHSVKTYNTSTDGFNNVSSINQSISGGSGTLIYDGDDNKTLVMSNGGSRAPEFDDFTISTSNAGNGYNVISNPYPASLDYDELNNDNASVNQTGYWIFSGVGGCPSGCGSWISKGNSDHISQNQGFLIETTGTSILFKVDQTIFSNPTFVKSTNGVNNPLKLRIHSHDSVAPYDFAYVYADANFSMDYDTLFEMPKILSPYPDYVSNLYFVDNDSNLIDRICINNNQSVDLNFDVKTGQYVHGDYTLSFESLPQFMIGSCLTLEDLHNGIITDLRTDSSYSFTSDSLAPSPRFKLQINVDYDINVTNSTCFQDSSSLVTLTGPSLQGNYFNLVDSSGIIISSITANQDSISFTGLNAGIYNISTNHIGSCALTNQEIIIVEPQEVIPDFLIFSDTFLLDTNGLATVDFKNISTGATHYNWSFGDGVSSDLYNPTHNYSTSGSYVIQLSAFSDSVGTCSNTIQKTITVIDPFSFVPSLVNNNDISINILNGILNINILSILKNDLSLSIYSLDGKEIHHSYLNSFVQQIDLNAIKSGIYFIRISDNTCGEIKFFNKFYLD